MQSVIIGYWHDVWCYRYSTAAVHTLSYHSLFTNYRKVHSMKTHVLYRWDQDRQVPYENLHLYEYKAYIVCGEQNYSFEC